MPACKGHESARGMRWKKKTVQSDYVRRITVRHWFDYNTHTPVAKSLWDGGQGKCGCRICLFYYYYYLDEIPGRIITSVFPCYRIVTKSPINAVKNFGRKKGLHRAAFCFFMLTDGQYENETRFCRCPNSLGILLSNKCRGID